MLVLVIGGEKYRLRVARRDRKVIIGLVKPNVLFEILRITNETN